MPTAPKGRYTTARPSRDGASTPESDGYGYGQTGVVHVDSRLRVVAANKSFTDMFLTGSPDPAGRPFPLFFHETAQTYLSEHLTQLLSGTQSQFSAPLPMVDAKGEVIDCLVSCVAIHATVHLSCTDCIALAFVRLDTPYGLSMPLLPAPPSLAEIPSHVLEGLAAGLSTQQLASRLGLSSHGVEYHVSSMLRKLKAPNRSALVARAYALGILVPNCWPPQVRPQYSTRSAAVTEPFPTRAG
ncbi:LuxR C-terminal-related transcriptional regulator [Streptomyces sp. NBC_01538]|uniref:LuxR C-terminal-related transcriptional regulator n=1 Tax=Streptomyces sp. NBC_01538 TaxID=2903897 RepID=UPI00386CD3A3